MVLMQVQCDCHIVVTDDGSIDNLFDKIEEFFFIWFYGLQACSES